MYLLIDQGNSRCKYLLTSSLGELAIVESAAWANDDFNEELWHQQLADLEQYAIKAVLVSSVTSQQRKDWFEGLCETVLKLTPQFASASKAYASMRHNNMVNSYDTPQALGVDRWLAMIAAFERVGGGFVVVDAGTAITSDWVDTNGKHRGGHIVAGGQMLQQSLMGKTGGIAWSASHDNALEGDGFGENTTSAVALGAETMIRGYCSQLIADLSEQSLSQQGLSQQGLSQQGLSQNNAKHLTFLITGGDGQIIADWLRQAVEESRLEYQVDYYPNLVLEGLSYWFSLNN